MSTNKRYIYLCLFALVGAFLYYPSFFSYFFQDDWFTLRISQVTSISGFFQLFLPRIDVVYYRPLGMQLYFFLAYSVFGLSPFGFHLIHFIVYCLIIYMIYTITDILTSDKTIALITSFMFSISAIQFIPFYWSSTFAFPLGFLCILCGFYYYLKWVNTQSRYALRLVLLFEVIGLCANETALLLPVIIVMYMVIYQKLHPLVIMRLSIPVLLYAVMRKIYLPDLNGTYTIEFGKKTIKAFIVYILWLSNWPEEIRNQLDNILSRNPAFLVSFRWMSAWLVTGTATIGALITSALYKNRKSKKRLKLYAFMFMLILVGIALPLAFPSHTYPYYLYVSEFGVAMLTSVSIMDLSAKMFQKSANFIICIPCFIILVASGFSLKFSHQNHWAPTRAMITQNIIEDMLHRYPHLSTKQRIFVPNDEELRVMLSGNEAFRIVYHLPELETVYHGNPVEVWKGRFDDKPEMKAHRLQMNYVE